MVIYDHASGLMWQQSGSDKRLFYGEAEKYVDKLNNNQFAGYSNWRLLTLEESMSLMEPTKNKDGLYINPVFDKKQKSIWTPDSMREISSYYNSWVVYFDCGYCLNVLLGLHYVRAVH